MKIKSIESYLRFRGFISKNNTRKHNDSTANGKMAKEYWNLLSMKSTSNAIQELIKKREEINL